MSITVILARYVVTALLLTLWSCFGAIPAISAVTERVSVSATGDQANGTSYDAVLSGDGRYVAFESWASNLVPGDTNGTCDVFVRDRLTGAVERVSVDSLGGQANDTATNPAITPDGRYVAFWSTATNLAPGDTNVERDVFVRDRDTGSTQIVSVSSAGVVGNGASGYPSISADGRYIAFDSAATNLSGGSDSNGTTDIFIRDMVLGTTWRVSNSATGDAANGESLSPRISRDGVWVAFTSEATDLVSDDTNGSRDVFAYRIPTNSVTRASVSSSGVEGNGHSEYPEISRDGRYVTFSSEASNLVAGDTNSHVDIFVNDSLTGITERISVSSGGVQGNADAYEPFISADGRFVAFNSIASNLAPWEPHVGRAAFLRDRVTGITECISLSATGEQANSDCMFVHVSDDGRCVAYWSHADNLVSGDTNSKSDVFLRDRFGNGYAYPENVSLSSSVPKPGAPPFTVTTTYRDANGYADIRRCYLLINDTLTQTNAALFYYDRAANKLYVKNDANTSWGTGYAPGTNVILENTQCYLYVNDTVVTGNDDEVTIKWSIALMSPFYDKQLKAYMYVQDSAGHTDGWEQMATYYNVKPEALSISPSTGQIPMDKWVTLTSYYRDLNGYEDLRKCYLLVNDALVQSNAMFAWYDRLTNKLYLKNDANTSWGTGYTLGTGTILENSQCMVRVGSTSAHASENSLAVTWSFLLKSATMGSKNLYSWMYAADSKGDASGYKKVGTHFTPVAPVCLSLSPNSGYVGTGSETPFMALYEDTNGWADIYKIYIQLSVTSSQANAVLLMYDAKQNKVFLRNDAGTSWGSGGVPGSATILENSQCKVNMASFGPPPWSVTDTQLQVSWPIELKPSQVGKRLCERLYVQDNALLNSGWHVFGYVRAE